MKITDTVLGAYVDGELAAEQAAAVEAAARLDPRLAEQIEGQRRLKTRMAGVFGNVIDEPAPAGLIASIAGAAAPSANVIDLAKARSDRSVPPARGRAGWAAWGALAAGLALVALVAQSQFAPASGPMIAYGPQGLAARGGLARALDHQLVADQSGAQRPVRILISFRSADGRYCRTFQIERGPGLAGLACREAEGWRVRVTAAASSGPTTQYRTAASTTPTVVLDSVTAMIAGQPLDAAGESAARSKGWRP